MRGFLKIATVCAASATALAASYLPAYLTGPPPGHTGAFNEPTCHVCHFDYTLNDGVALMKLDSLPAMYEANREYRLQLRLQHPELKRGGFQLSARFEDGSPAGTFVIPDTLLLRIQSIKQLGFLSHTTEGTDQVVGDTAVWTFAWRAPASDQRVVFNAAFNVSDKDASQFGDRIFTTSFYSQAAPPRGRSVPDL